MRKVHEVGNISFGRAIDDFWCGFLNFTGHSTRKGLFYNILMLFVYICLGYINFCFYFNFSEELGWTAANVMMIIIALAYFSAFCRRLRDVGLSAIAIILLLGVYAIYDIVDDLFFAHEIYILIDNSEIIFMFFRLYDLFVFVLLLLPSNKLRGKKGFLFLKD